MALSVGRQPTSFSLEAQESSQLLHRSRRISATTPNGGETFVPRPQGWPPALSDMKRPQMSTNTQGTFWMTNYWVPDETFAGVTLHSAHAIKTSHPSTA